MDPTPLKGERNIT